MSTWQDHYCRLPKLEHSDSKEPTDISRFRENIEPWLSAIFQSEHLAVLAGNGLTTAVAEIAKANLPKMGRVEFISFKDEIKKYAEKTAKDMGRGAPNFEDDIRTALELLRGLMIQGEKRAPVLEDEIGERLKTFINSILEVENSFIKSTGRTEAMNYLKSFLVSFASRTATRDRLQMFTTNYDRFIEYGCDMAGIIIIDKFMGKIEPVFRNTKLELDYHYNPPGIRGEPRYVEGVIRLIKLHGSIDWHFMNDRITRAAMSFGLDPAVAGLSADTARQFAIYPNSAKDIETAYYPYAELFRDFSAAICRPNSVLVTYGYGFGDSHINRIIEDMLKIASTHIVVISYDNASGRIQEFYNKNNPAQFSLFIGKHFGDLKTLVDNYLPKAAIDRLTVKMHKIKENRGDTTGSDTSQAEIKE